MHWFLRVVCLLVLGHLADGTAFAQSSPHPSAGKAAEDTKAMNDALHYWLKTCLADWDQATHMTKSEWRTTCKRVAEERRTFLPNTPDASSIGTRGAATLERLSAWTT